MTELKEALDARDRPYYTELGRIGDAIGFGRAQQMLGELWDGMLEDRYGPGPGAGGRGNMSVTVDDDLPPLPKAASQRRAQSHHGGYRMVPAYSVAEMKAFGHAAIEKHTDRVGAVYEGGRESVDDALAVVESFGPGIAGLNDTFARQIILANEVRRLRAVYEQAVHGRSAFRSALVDCRAALRTAHDHLDMHRLRVSHATDAEQIEKALGIQDCEGCNGSGEQKHLTSHLGPNDYEVDGPCSRCGGHGWVMVGYGETAGADACPVCVGGQRG